MSSIDYDELPTGWLKQYDEQSQHFFWVDTTVKPPRAIWMHPYEDEQFLNEHPDIKRRIREQTKERLTSEDPPPYSRRHSFSGAPRDAHDSLRTARSPDLAAESSSSGDKGKGKGKDKDKDKQKEKGFLSKLKDKAIGTKEEREEARKYHERIAAEQRRQELAARQQYRDQYQRQSGYGPPPGSPAPYGSYGGSYGGYGGYGSSYDPYNPYGASPYDGRGQYYGGDPYGDRFGRRRGGGGGGFGGGGLALPLIGGLAGGLLLGDVLGF